MPNMMYIESLRKVKATFQDSLEHARHNIFWIYRWMFAHAPY